MIKNTKETCYIHTVEQHLTLENISICGDNDKPGGNHNKENKAVKDG